MRYYTATSGAQASLFLEHKWLRVPA